LIFTIVSVLDSPQNLLQNDNYTSYHRWKFTKNQCWANWSEQLTAVHGLPLLFFAVWPKRFYLEFGTW